MKSDAEAIPGATPHVRRSGSAAHVTLKRPPRNLLVPELMDSLRETLLALDADDEVRAIALRGEGEAFCGGLDVERMRAGNPGEFGAAAVKLLRIFPGLGTPVIAAVNGDALALGYSLVCSADVALSVPEARIGTFEASFGLWPMVAQVPPLQRFQSRQVLENILTGEPFSAERALQIGIVNRVVEADDMDDAVDDWLKRVTGAGDSVAVGRRGFYRLLDKDPDSALDDALEMFEGMLPAP